MGKKIKLKFPDVRPCRAKGILTDLDKVECPACGAVTERSDPDQDLLQCSGCLLGLYLDPVAGVIVDWTGDP